MENEARVTESGLQFYLPPLFLSKLELLEFDVCSYVLVNCSWFVLNCKSFTNPSINLRRFFLPPPPSPHRPLTLQFTDILLIILLSNKNTTTTHTTRRLNLIPSELRRIMQYVFNLVHCPHPVTHTPTHTHTYSHIHQHI